MMAAPEKSLGRLMGGGFGLPAAPVVQGRAPSVQWRFLDPSALFLANARSAFWLLVKTFRSGRIWLPSYLCDTVVKGFRTAGRSVEFFAVDARLRCIDHEWIDRVREGDFVLRINYFGFINRDPAFSVARARGACLIDDAAQALLTPGLGADAGFIVYSPRKFIGVPDGGCLVPIDPAAFRSPRLEPAPELWWNRAHAAVRLRREFEQTGADTGWFGEFQAAERYAPVGPYAMSDVSRQLLQTGFDFDAIARIRRENYRALARQLGEFALFPDLSDEAVPVGFPVVVKERDRVRQALFRERIFPPVHWAINGVVPDAFADSHRLAHSVMTLPCDQRLDLADMDRAADRFLAAM